MHKICLQYNFIKLKTENCLHKFAREEKNNIINMSGECNFKQNVNNFWQSDN
jgi:hypothetical protein